MHSPRTRFALNSRIVRATAATLVLWLCATAFAVTENTVHSFVSYANGSTPEASLISDSAGNLYTTTEYGGTHGNGAVIEITPTSTGLTEHVLYSFIGTTDGEMPMGGLVFDHAGNLYGTAANGGAATPYGTVFELSPGSNRAWTFKTIHTFGKYVDGHTPEGSLTIDSSGNLYGTTRNGGARGSGTVFEVSPTATGWSESVLYSFEYQAGDGINPVSGVILDGKGNLYGTTPYGPRNAGGTVFELSPAGSAWAETILYKFTGPDGNNPSTLVFDKAGNLYGAALEGGAHGNDGCIFELVAANGWAPTVLYSFAGGADGNLLVGGLTSDQAGNLYGTTYFGGTGVCSTNGCGTVYELSPSSSGWTKTILHNFAGGSDGSNPATQVFVDAAGNVYGTTSGILPIDFPGLPSGGTAFRLTPGSAGTWTESVLSFSGTDGYSARAGLISDSNGNLYGTTTYGGVYGLGAVYEIKLNTNGNRTEKLLYSFAGVPDGQYPFGKLVFDQAGNLYGTTNSGGASTNCNGYDPPYGCGAVYRLSPTETGPWSEEVIYSFTGPTADAFYPVAGLAIDGEGNLYGTAVFGGANGYGAAFEISPNGSGWTESVIHSFGAPSSNDGIYPNAPMILDSEGNLYGTTYEGGGVTNGSGTVFELSPSSSGWTETILHAFGTAGDGDGPVAGVVFDKLGNLYGTTVWGGSAGSDSPGTVYRLMPNSNGKWSETVLYSFGQTSTDGQKPECDLVIDASGNLYGTTWVGGTNYDGTVFELSRSSSGWTETILHSFVGTDGSGPEAGLLMDSAGNLYGTNSVGGSANSGNIFEVMP